MKQLVNQIKFPVALTALLLAAGCAINAQSTDNLAIAAGFKVITPTRPDQQAILAKLPKDKVSRVNYRGATYYVVPDSMNNLAYVGNARQYQAFQQLRSQRQLSNDEFEAKQLNEMDNVDWGSWSGSGAGFVPLP